MKLFAETNNDAVETIKNSAQLSEAVMHDLGKPLPNQTSDNAGGKVKTHLEQSASTLENNGILPGLSIDGIKGHDEGKPGVKGGDKTHQLTNQEIKELMIDKIKGLKGQKDDVDSHSNGVKGGTKKEVHDGGVKTPEPVKAGELIVKPGTKPQVDYGDKPVIKKPAISPDAILVD